MLCTKHWMEYVHNNTQDEELSIVEKFQSFGNIPKENNQERVSPLVSQAGEFALIINPPAPPEVKVEEKPQPKVATPVVLAPRPSVKFKLLSISYNRDRPEDSVALIDEPGKDDHWAKAGDNIGNFVLERIEPGIIIYRYGSQVNEMAVEMKPPVRIAQERKSILGLE